MTGMPRVPVLALAVCSIVAFTPPGPAAAAEKDAARTISLSGMGSAKGSPDTAHISTGVVSEAATAREALDKNNGAMARVIDELKAQGLEPKNIQTTNFSVRPRFQHFKDGKPPVISGYRVVNSVRIKVSDLTKLGIILDKVVTLGSNQIGGIEFSVADAANLKDMARREAMADASHKAKLYAEAAGAKLGKVLKISEDFAQIQPRPAFARAALEAKAATAPIEPGEQTLQARVNVTWELE